MRYSTFNLVYKDRWSDILRFRSRSLFTTCEVCCAFKTQLQDRSLSFEQKLGCLQGYRQHLHSQYCDRTVIWTLQSEGGDPHSDILMICTDGLDQAKFSLPRDPQLRANAGLNLRSISGYHFILYPPKFFFAFFGSTQSNHLELISGQSINDPDWRSMVSGPMDSWSAFVSWMSRLDTTVVLS